MMKTQHCALIILATAFIGALGRFVIAASRPLSLSVSELAVAVGVVALLFARVNALAVVTFVTAAVVLAANQLLLARGYLTFLNAAQMMSADVIGPLAADISAAVVVASVTIGGFYIRRVWAWVTVAVILACATWPASLAGVHI